MAQGVTFTPTMWTITPVITSAIMPATIIDITLRDPTVGAITAIVLSGTISRAPRTGSMA
jgi:hypothetical protein